MRKSRSFQPCELDLYLYPTFLREHSPLPNATPSV
jgi:hypothetical protein